MQVLNLKDVTKKVGVGRSTLYAMIKKEDFPKQFNLSERSVGWLESEVDQWIIGRAETRTIH